MRKVWLVSLDLLKSFVFTNPYSNTTDCMIGTIVSAATIRVNDRFAIFIDIAIQSIVPTGVV